MLAGLAGTTAGAAVLWVAKGTPGIGGGSSPSRGEREAAFRAGDASAFGSRDESYASASGVGQEAPAGETMLFASASEAAAATQVTTPTVLATDRPVVHLLRRVTFGPTPELVAEVEDKGIDAWLAEQLEPSELGDGTADQVWGQFPMASMGPSQVHGAVEEYAWDAMHEYGMATLARQVWSTRQLFEVMVDFWGNHLNVTIPSGPAWDVGPSYHNDVIRRHALGSFTDMLLASARHPGMLKYLNNAESDKESVNENYGRELLELHTVGVTSGYTEDDVRNSAYILTGRTVGGDDDPNRGAFVYDPEKHWTGAVRVLDFQHANPTADAGLDVGDEYLRYLASHPATAQTVARKLAVRFVADNPPQTLVDRLAQAYLDNDTAVVPVLDVLFRSRELWAAVGAKTRRPLENLVASMRVVGMRPGPATAEVVEHFYWQSGQMGQKPLGWVPPNGYPDVQAAWRSASGLLAAWNAHRAVAEGWQDGATYVPPTELVAGRPQATVGEYVDSMCERLCFQRIQPQHRDTLLLFVGAPAEAPTDESDLEWKAGQLAALVLDTAYFALR